MDQSAGISLQEFEQLQQQIVSLRTENYDLQSKQGRYAKELYELKQKTDVLTSENARLNKIVGKDKKARDLEQLLAENERLQQKLSSQESDFQLQCKTLMSEITQLSSDKELLSQTMEQYKHVIAASLSPDEIDALRSELVSLREECSRLRSGVARSISINESGVDSVDVEKHEDSLSAVSTVSERDTAVSTSNDSALLDLKMQIASMQNERKMLLAELDESKKQVQSLQAANSSATTVAGEKQHAYEQVLGEKTTLIAECASLNERCLALQDFQCKYDAAEVQLRELTTMQKEQAEKHSSEVTALSAEIEDWKGKYSQLTAETEKLTNELSSVQAAVENSSAAAESTSIELSAERNKLSELQAQFETQTQQLLDMETKYSEASEQMGSLLANSEDMEQQIAELSGNVNSSQQECEELKNLLALKEAELEKLMEESTNAMAQSEKCQKDLEAAQEQFSTQEAELTSRYSQKETELEELRREIQLIRRDAEETVATNRRKDAAHVKDLQRQLKTEKRRVQQLQERLEQLFQQSSSSLNPSESSPHHMSGLSSEFDRKSIDHDNFDSSSVSSFSLSQVKHALFGGSSAHPPTSKTMSSTGSILSPSHSSLPVVHASNDTVAELAAQLGKLNLENDRLREKISYLESTSASMAEDVLKKQQVIDHYLMADRQSTTVSPSVSINSGFGNSGNMMRRGESSSPAPVTFKSLFEKVANSSNNNNNNNGQNGSGSTEETKRLKRAMEEILTKNMSLEADLKRLIEENVQLKSQRNSETSATSTITH